MASSQLREAVKRAARGAAAILVAPLLISHYIRAAIMGADRALEGSSQRLARIPGIRGQYLRAAFYSRVLAHCDPSASIGYGTLFSKAGASIDEDVYIGANCQLGLVHIERDVMLGSGVHVTSGRHTHGTEDVSTVMRDQPGTRELVRIGAGAWIGSGAIVMASVGAHTVVGAGAVVTKPIPDTVVAAGVPAKVVRMR